MRTLLSGTQHALRAGDYEAVIASVGASLRSLTYDGRDLTVPFDADEVRPSYRGATLAPWPNRVVDGKYTFARRRAPGRAHRAGAPPRAARPRGLARLRRRSTRARATSRCRRRSSRRRLPVAHRDRDDVLARRRRAHADGDGDQRESGCRPLGHRPAPVPGGGGRARRRLDPRPARGRGARGHPRPPQPDRAATRSMPTTRTRFDFREARQIGAVEIDHAYTALARDAEGFATVRVTDAGRLGRARWRGMPRARGCRSTPPTRAWASPGTARGLAVEPMTCAPDAFNADRYDYDAGLIVLEPGASASASWRISAHRLTATPLSSPRVPRCSRGAPFALTTTLSLQRGALSRTSVRDPAAQWWPGSTISPCGTACWPASVAASAGVATPATSTAATMSPTRCRAAGIRLRRAGLTAAA